MDKSEIEPEPSTIVVLSPSYTFWMTMTPAELLAYVRRATALVIAEYERTGR